MNDDLLKKSGELHLGNPDASGDKQETVSQLHEAKSSYTQLQNLLKANKDERAR